MTSFAPLLFLCVALASAQTLNLVKFSQTFAASSGALCNDGSPGSYYISAGATVNNFIIYLQGGALCFDATSCAPRVGTSLYSSVNYTATQPAFIIPDKPQWTNWTKVFVPYCSSDLYAGTVTTPTSFGFIFAGNFILRAIFQDLIANHGLSNVSQVLFWGDSAGAVGVINNIDLLASYIPGARVQGVANSGWFISHFTFGGTPTIAQLGAFTSAEYQARLNAACLPNSNTCYLTPTVYPFIKQKMFFIQSFIDEFEIDVELGFNANFTAPNASLFLQDVGATYKTDLAQFQTKPGDDWYLLTCFLHVPDITAPFINGVAAVDAVVNWFFNGVTSHLGDKCNLANVTNALVLNPTLSCQTITTTCQQDALVLPALVPVTTAAAATSTPASNTAATNTTIQRTTVMGTTKSAATHWFLSTQLIIVILALLA